VLAQRVLGLPVKPTDDQKRIVALERQLARAREAKRDGRKAQGDVARLEVELADARRALADAQAESARVRAACDAACATCRSMSPADRVLDAAIAVLRAHPPAGVDVGYLDGFVARHMDRLRVLVAGVAERRGGAA
jgi:hypothetical protein